MSTWLPVPTGRLAAVAAVASVLVVMFPSNSTTGLVTVNLLLAVVALADWLLAPPPGSIAVERVVPPVVALHHEARIEWTLANPTARKVRLAFADDLAPSLRAQRRRIEVTIPAGGRARAATVVEPSRRGRFELRELVVRVEGPLGLAARQDKRVLAGTLRVYPSFASKEDAELRINKGRILEVGLRSAQGRGGGTEFDSLREYGPDDEFRRIDWAATARLGKPIVRTYRAERNQTVLLLLDNGRIMAGRVGDGRQGGWGTAWQGGWGTASPVSSTPWTP